jgi:hypothetical protein
MPSEYTPRLRQPTVEVRCARCDSPFRSTVYRLAHYNVRFCSRDCYHGSRVDAMQWDSPDALRACNVCGVAQPMTNYARARGNGGRPSRRGACKTCRSAYTAQWNAENRERVRVKANARRAQNPNSVRISHLKSAYGLSPAEYDEMLAKQGGGCAICHEACPTGRQLAVDHDHTTGRVRGLLCTRCNIGLGTFLDTVSRLESAIQYLARSTS